jgi:hypothetical protein
MKKAGATHRFAHILVSSRESEAVLAIAGGAVAI